MRAFIIFFSIFFLAACETADKKPAEQKTASHHSDEFNRSFDAMMNDYYTLSEAFVAWDLNAVDSGSRALENSIRSISLEDLKNDTAVHATAVETLKNVTASAGDISKSPDLTSKRHNFNALSQNIYDLLRVAKYDMKKLYLQECPMAFDDTESGLWLTEKGTDSIRNPYLGLRHPKYGSSMLECGSNKSTIDFQKK